MFTLCILFTTLATNTKGMCEGASKQTPDPKILPRRDPPPLWKFLDPPLISTLFTRHDRMSWNTITKYFKDIFLY